MESAQGAGKGRFPGPVVAHHADYLTLCGGKADAVQDRPLFIPERDIPKLQDRGRCWRVNLRRPHRRQVRRPQSHAFPGLLWQSAELFRRKNLLDPALLQVYDPVRQIHQIIEPVLRDQDGLALLLKQPQMAF